MRRSCHVMKKRSYFFFLFSYRSIIFNGYVY